MPFVRVSIVHPRRGQRERAVELLDQLVEYYSKQPGYITGYRLEHNDGSDRLGRIGIWESEEAAERAAGTEYDMALRAEFNRAVDSASHEEYSFEAVGAPASQRP